MCTSIYSGKNASALNFNIFSGWKVDLDGAFIKSKLKILSNYFLEKWVKTK